MKIFIQLILLLFSILPVLSACAEEDEPVAEEVVGNKEATQPIQQVSNSIPSSPAWQYPRRRKLAGYDVTVHAPQIMDWDDFSEFKALIVVEVHLPDQDILANFALSGQTQVDLDRRLVTIIEPKVDSLTFSGTGSESLSDQLKKAVQEDQLEIPIDLFLFSLAEGAVDLPSSVGFSDSAPFIKVTWSPTLLLFVNGDPFMQEIEGSGLELIINANWPVVVDNESSQYYLLNKQTWLQAERLNGPWELAEKFANGFEQIAADGEFSALSAAYANTSASGSSSDNSFDKAPEVFFTNRPAELIVIDGEPKFEVIPDTNGLQFVSNTQSPLFVSEDKFYFLTSGRWFSSSDLIAWELVPELPDTFSNIPNDHGMSYVRSSITGTLESKLAILEAYLPVENVIDAKKVLEVDEQFDGNPEFKPVTDTDVSRAVNTPLNIIEYQGVYYLCFEGAWYQADRPVGPWTVAFRVPEAVYDIPAGSPAYSVTQVTVASTTPTTVIYQYPQGYSSGIYLSYGVAVYGTGWYYPPYRGLYFYPWFGSYGHGNYYNPNSGRYTTRSVWQGPYGGYSYNQYSNAQTGRYGFVETAWDGDEWASYGESYNPRTQVYSETERYYSDDTERFEMERETYRGDESMYTERKVDLDDGWSETTRKTSDGGSSAVTRHRQEDGSIIKEGNVTAADGRTAEISGVYDNGKSTTNISGSEGKEGTIERSRDASGVSREGTFANDSGESVNAKTERDGRTTKSHLEGSGGSEAISRSDGNSRSTLAKDSSGDLYASRDGNVYKKGNEGWQSFNSDSNKWQQADSTRAESTGNRNQTTTGSSWKSQAKSVDSYRDSSSQLQRDARSRHGSYNQFNQRRGNTSRYSGSRARAGGSRGRR